MTLNELRAGSCAVVASVNGAGALRRRLLDMGITPKTIIKVIKTAPMGDPIQVRLRDYDLTLRLKDARNIEITEVKGNDICPCR